MPARVFARCALCKRRRACAYKPHFVWGQEWPGRLRPGARAKRPKPPVCGRPGVTTPGSKRTGRPATLEGGRRQIGGTSRGPAAASRRRPDQAGNENREVQRTRRWEEKARRCRALAGRLHQGSLSLRASPAFCRFFAAFSPAGPFFLFASLLASTSSW